ncbi:hypothetical protein [Planctomycetes bacterium Pan216]|uniref:hypothetical protein n=1 Tax=Kolteria novifilia TaxID=2527975 RepID=UPI0011A47129
MGIALLAGCQSLGANREVSEDTMNRWSPKDTAEQSAEANRPATLPPKKVPSEALAQKPSPPREVPQQIRQPKPTSAPSQTVSEPTLLTVSLRPNRPTKKATASEPTIPELKASVRPASALMTVAADPAKKASTTTVPETEATDDQLEVSLGRAVAAMDGVADDSDSADVAPPPPAPLFGSASAKLAKEVEPPKLDAASASGTLMPPPPAPLLSETDGNESKPTSDADETTAEAPTPSDPKMPATVVAALPEETSDATTPATEPTADVEGPNLDKLANVADPTDTEEPVIADLSASLVPKLPPTSVVPAAPAKEEGPEEVIAMKRMVPPPPACLADETRPLTAPTEPSPGLTMNSPGEMPASPKDGSDDADLVLDNTKLCKQIKGFGSVVPTTSDQLRPGQQLLVYTEVKNFASSPAGSGFETSLASKITIETADGTVLHPMEFDNIHDRCQTKRHDFYCHYTFILPSHLPAGNYLLRLKVKDLKTDSMGERTLAFSIAPASTIAQRSIRATEDQKG